MSLPFAFPISVHFGTFVCMDVKTGVLNLRDVPKDLIAHLKIEAIQNGMTLKDWCCHKLAHKCSELKPGGDTGSTSTRRK
jgi:porphobilinogen deaminase